MEAIMAHRAAEAIHLVWARMARARAETGSHYHRTAMARAAAILQVWVHAVTSAQAATEADRKVAMAVVPAQETMAHKATTVVLLLTAAVLA